PGVAAARSIELKTSVPGPRSREILERKARVIADPLSIYLPVVAAEGRGALLTDVDGNTFVDFTGGVGCLNVGHAHPHVTAAVQEQAGRVPHTRFTEGPHEGGASPAPRPRQLPPLTAPRHAPLLHPGAEGGA